MQTINSKCKYKIQQLFKMLSKLAQIHIDNNIEMHLDSLDTCLESFLPRDAMLARY